uniref:Uncharacterized protein n=1 Tax=Rhizophora mucronata TaxID=61149 RepID=A0A2P2QJB7_RHIMU
MFTFLVGGSLSQIIRYQNPLKQQ